MKWDVLKSFLFFSGFDFILTSIAAKLTAKLTVFNCEVDEKFTEEVYRKVVYRKEGFQRLRNGVIEVNDGSIAMSSSSHGGACWLNISAVKSS